MKNILILLLTAVVFSSCALCPHGGGPVSEKRVQRHDRKPFRASVPKRQWMKQRSDGYWLVYTTKGFSPTKLMVFECKPDSAQLASL